MKGYIKIFAIIFLFLMLVACGPKEEEKFTQSENYKSQSLYLESLESESLEEDKPSWN
ncbi:MAG: hypothetical protein Q4E36_05175 [Bacillota bacterium]|nr:hypothetical protein [Bacillota bacterium]